MQHDDSRQQCRHCDNAQKQGRPDTAIDPVCGMSVDKDSKIRREHGGETYYFCAEHCSKRSVADPESFLKPARNIKEETASSSGSAVWYTCPAH